MSGYGITHWSNVDLSMLNEDRFGGFLDTNDDKGLRALLSSILGSTRIIY